MHPDRPRWHLSPPAWMNDPMPVWDGRRLHVFFQHNPAAARWADICWGHASSDDLARWELHPLALRPGAPHDRAGVFTGSVVHDGERWWAFYTGVTRLDPLEQLQCAATSADLSRWEKLPDPLLAEPPPGFHGCWRDPKVWRERDGWHMLIGAECGGGATLHYESDDLLRWRYSGTWYVDRYGDTGVEFECPDLLRLEGHEVLITSASAHRSGPWKRSYVHALGTRIGGLRYRRSCTALDSGCLYAARTTSGGPRLLFGWLDERCSAGEQLARGWSGVLSLPRELHLRGQEVCQRPWSGLAALRQEEERLAPRTVRTPWSLGASWSAEIALSWSGPVRFRIGPHEVRPPLQASSVRLFVDRSAVELIYDRGPSHALRVYGDDREILLSAPEPVSVEGGRFAMPGAR